MPRITAAEAADLLRTETSEINNSRRIPKTSKRIRQLQMEETFPICNVGPRQFFVERGSLRWHIPAYDPTKDKQGLGYAASKGIPVIFRECKILDENEFTYIEDDGRDVANDLIGVGFMMAASNSLLPYGVFVPSGSEPTREEIAQANAALHEYRQSLVAEARQAYDLGPRERAEVIADRHQEAGRALGLDEVWMHQTHTQQKVRCEMCGQYNPEGVAKCSGCNAVIDEALFLKLEERQAAIRSRVKNANRQQ